MTGTQKRHRRRNSRIERQERLEASGDLAKYERFRGKVKTMLESYAIEMSIYAYDFIGVMNTYIQWWSAPGRKQR